MKTLGFLMGVALLAAGVGGCGGGSPDRRDPSEVGDQVASQVRNRLDCGTSKAGSKDALRQFFAILRRGDRVEVRSVLIDPPRFMWLNVNGRRGGPHVNVRNDPDKAARAVARRGGLPLTIRRFMNADPPGRETGLGFWGRWNRRRHVVGKAAIDCTQGKVIVLSAGVRRQ